MNKLVKAHKILILAIILISVSSCYKKKIKQIEGVYLGVETLITKDWDSTNVDTSTYEQTIQIENYEKNFNIIKDTYPGEFTITARPFAKYGTYNRLKYLPLRDWSLSIADDSLFGVFRYESFLSNERSIYSFRGVKVE